MTDPIFKPGDKCPCKNCDGHILPEREADPYGTEDFLICDECGYCPEDEFDGRIDDCPQCGSWAYVINQGNIVCSGCTLEMSADDEETALAMWNGIARKPKEQRGAGSLGEP